MAPDWGAVSMHDGRGMRPPSTDLTLLPAVVKLSGGLRTVAVAAGVDASNLSKFLRGGGGLSGEKQSLLEAALGRPGGQADPTRVVVLRATRANEDLVDALRWHVPGGARVARAAWSAVTKERLKKFFRANLTPEIYAVSDGRARVLVLLPAGPMMPPDLFPREFPELRWWENDPDRAVLDLGDPVPWAKGEIGVIDFDDAWPGKGYHPSMEDVVQEIRRLGISPAEAIRLLNLGRLRTRA